MTNWLFLFNAKVRWVPPLRQKQINIILRLWRILVYYWNLNFVGYWLSSRLQLQIMVFLDEYIDKKSPTAMLVTSYCKMS